MRRPLAHSLLRAVVVGVIASVIIVGGVYAHETLWSGTAHITVEPPAGVAELEVTQVTVSKGTWDESSETWTVSLVRGEFVMLDVHLENTGSDVAVVHGEINGSYTFYPREGIEVATGYQPAYDGIGILGGETSAVRFTIRADVDAEAGEVPEVQLQVVEGPRD